MAAKNDLEAGIKCKLDCDVVSQQWLQIRLQNNNNDEYKQETKMQTPFI